MTKTLVLALIAGALVPGAAIAADAAPSQVVVAQAAKGDTAEPKAVGARAVTVRGTVEAVDKDKGTVTLKGPKRSLTIQVRDPKKLEMIKVGDPVVAKYYEALAIELKKPGEGAPSVSTQQAVASSKPGETPSGAVGQEIKATVTVASIDKKAGTLTVKGPAGGTEVIKARDPKNLDKVKPGDMIELTYTQALAISLDKPAAKK